MKQHYHPVTGQPLNVTHRVKYESLPTIRQFHECTDLIKCIVGPVGSGKTRGATMEICWRFPGLLHNRYGIKKTRFIVLRNTYPMLIDSTQKTIFEQFPPGVFGKYNKNEKNYDLNVSHKVLRENRVETVSVELLFRSCDNVADVEKFRGYELTGYYIDESDEVAEGVKLMLKQRIGRFPSFEVWKMVLRERADFLQKLFKKKYNINIPDLSKLSDSALQDEVKNRPNIYQTSIGIETTNPPTTESPTYYTFDFKTKVPGPKPEKAPLKLHSGFWQPPYENAKNLSPGYYENMREMYKNSNDWIERYILGKPGVMLKGKNVYHNFSRDMHESKEKLKYKGGIIWRGWDHSGNTPACVVCQMPAYRQIEVLKEFYTGTENIVDFGKRVVSECNRIYPDAIYIDYGDPAGWQKFSSNDGTFTSNAKLLKDECNVKIKKSDQNYHARIIAVDNQLSELVGGIPAFKIDPDCVRLINGFMGGYFYPEIGGNTGIFRDRPLKNDYSHPHDALQYIVIKLRDGSPGEEVDDTENFGRHSDALVLC